MSGGCDKVIILKNKIKIHWRFSRFGRPGWFYKLIIMSHPPHSFYLYVWVRATLKPFFGKLVPSYCRLYNTYYSYVMRRMMLCADASKKFFRPSFKNKHRGCESTLKTSAKREKKNTVCFSLHYLYTV